MISITFEAHATSLDNEAGRASGHRDCPLSPLGREQAHELGGRYQGLSLGHVYCSDLRRSWETAEIAFKGRPVTIHRDMRLRECDYGKLSGVEASFVTAHAPKHLRVPFPSGESYADAMQRVRDALAEMSLLVGVSDLLIIGHRATQYGLEHWIKGVSVLDAIKAPWQWQPGWRYELDHAATLRLRDHPDEFS